MGVIDRQKNRLYPEYRFNTQSAFIVPFIFKPSALEPFPMGEALALQSREEHQPLDHNER